VDLEDLPGAGADPIMGQDLYLGTYRGKVKIFKGYVTAPILPVPGVMAEEGRRISDPRLGKDPDRGGTGAPDPADWLGKFPEKHGPLEGKAF
jgi:hypothetical protein